MLDEMSGKTVCRVAYFKRILQIIDSTAMQRLDSIVIEDKDHFTLIAVWIVSNFSFKSWVTNHTENFSHFRKPMNKGLRQGDCSVETSYMYMFALSKIWYLVIWIFDVMWAILCCAAFTPGHNGVVMTYMSFTCIICFQMGPSRQKGLCT